MTMTAGDLQAGAQQNANSDSSMTSRTTERRPRATRNLWRGGIVYMY